METKLQLIREKCIEANPSIKDLVVGSIAISPVWKDKKMIYLGYFMDTSEYGNGDDLHQFVYFGKGGYVSKNIDDIKILGREIRLADVLLAMKSLKERKWTDQAWLITGSKDDCNWNLLKDSLTDQSEETIEFLYELLK